MASRMILRTVSLATALAWGGIALAQTTAPATGAMSTPATAPNTSDTGAHMPDVGASKSAGVTPLDKKVEKKMRKETTICKGC